jgi:hypothetical protein
MLVHLSDRKVMRLHAPEEDLVAFLNGLVTNNVANVGEDTPVWGALLTAQGKYLADMVIFAGGADEVLLDLPAQRYDAAEAALRRYRLRRKIDISESRQQVFAGWNDRLLVAPNDPRSEALGKRWLGAVESVTGELDDYHAHRMQIGIPDSADFIALGEEKLMWLESGADLLGGVDFTKGCFVGQENTARMNYRGKVRKRILPVTLSDDPGSSQDITADGKPAGTLTGFTHTADGWIGMALLRLEKMDLPMEIGSVRLSVRVPDWLPPRTNTDGDDLAANEREAELG